MNHNLPYPSNVVNTEALSAPTDKFSSDDLRDCFEKSGLVGANPAERLESLRHMEVHDIAGMIEDINKGMIGSSETMLSDTTMYHERNGERNGSFVPVEHRYDLFESITDKIKHASKEIDPSRIGDALALAIVILHPFKDANGRTARAVGYAFRDWYDDKDEYTSDFSFYMSSRDEMKTSGSTFRPIGYMPRHDAKVDYSNPKSVEAYFDRLLEPSEADESLYVGTYGQAPATS